SIISLDVSGTQTLSQDQKEKKTSNITDNQSYLQGTMGFGLLSIHGACGFVPLVWKRRLQLLFLCVCASGVVYGQVRYSIPEEMVKGSVVGNIAQDLGLDIILDNPMELHRVDVEILDINDNAPWFSKTAVDFEISESALPGTIFSLDSAKDRDVGINSLQTYNLTPTDHFNVKILSRLDGTKYVEMVLQIALDRETQDEHKLILTAYDGGNPQKSGSINIKIVVLDANDNAPTFLQTVTIPEDSIPGTIIAMINIKDSDS
ncbi:hypothetical protein Z043_125887, partial [Scleropages formosus]